MNAIFFGCKRAFHGFLHITRPWLRDLGLTAARFDMLTAIWKSYGHGIGQRELVDMLGVTAATISRMLKSLEKLGLLTRTRPSNDLRRRDVQLTAKGITTIRRATRCFIGSGAAQLAVDCALSENRVEDYDLCFNMMDWADDILRRLRHAFGDIAQLYYPWHPDD